MPDRYLYPEPRVRIGHAARPEPRGHGVHRSERRPRRRRSPDRRGERRRRRSSTPTRCRSTRRRAALVRRPGRRRDRSRPPSPAATTTSCCSRCRRGRGGGCSAVRAAAPASPCTRIGVCTADRGRRAAHARAAGRRRCPRGSPTSDDSPHQAPWSAGGWSTLLHVDDTPERTAAAFALGRVLRLLAVPRASTRSSALVFAFLLNLNRVAVLLGVYSNLPWIIARVLRPHDDGRRVAARARRCRPGSASSSRQLFELSLFHGDFWHAAGARFMRPLFWPYTVGLAARGGGASLPVALAVSALTRQAFHRGCSNRETIALHRRRGVTSRSTDDHFRTRSGGKPS